MGALYLIYKKKKQKTEGEDHRTTPVMTNPLGGDTLKLYVAAKRLGADLAAERSFSIDNTSSSTL